MTYSLLDHPHFQALFGREELAALFSADAEIAAMLRVEAALAEAEAEAGVIPDAAADAIHRLTETFQADADVLAEGVARDGLVVPVLIEALRKQLGLSHRPYLHFGATSQDVIDTGLVLRLKAALVLLRADIEMVVGRLDELDAASGGQPLMARTRMQRALEFRVADRIGIWKAPLVQHLDALAGLLTHALAVQLGGPVGTLDKLGDKGPHVRRLLADRLGLADPGQSWHADRTRIVDIGTWLSKISGTLGKIGQDVVLMAQNEIGEAALEGGGLSSAMPHKKNPIRAELLVTLARYNAVEQGALHQALVHEGERSGSAWTLEWLALPQMVATTGAALLLARRMLDALTFPHH
jgi:3-carboxy-cis,cis-muconate cycloisomerase